MPSNTITSSTHVPTIKWQSLKLELNPLEPTSDEDDRKYGSHKHAKASSPKVEIGFIARGTFEGSGSLAIRELGEQLREIKAHIDAEVQQLGFTRERFCWRVSLSSGESDEEED